jgi:hypothetical protein
MKEERVNEGKTLRTPPNLGLGCVSVASGHVAGAVLIGHVARHNDVAYNTRVDARRR